MPSSRIAFQCIEIFHIANFTCKHILKKRGRSLFVGAPSGMLTRMWKLKAGQKKVARKATELRKEHGFWIDLL
jgi:hypothetical protein